ncbi:hypothetical protein GYMLUDRAFT_177878 [Collybiopsis luxurians FD-317 M1]|uniref:DNA helicase n=1 Tax=Collybiopsis luxurians FD-317 M1 TaxID=944289 RepID=A0A0D0C808_9AGAR|nr:hypothetical protein GYMLUDRAFT_177878 [Collybiopsis luxurians FD-317 M1]
MRNCRDNTDDIKFRRTLENMRYKACTPEDIKFLRSLVSLNRPGCHYISSALWRDTPIIVFENRQKDEINRLGCLHFAADTSQVLTHFYCTDTISTASEECQVKSSAKCKANSRVNTMSTDLQQVMWDLPASSHENHAAPVLSLCLGLPVIICYNVATELNITKGQQATVYMWHASKADHGKLVLDVLFVLLENPPSPVILEGLLHNVVPLLPRKNAGYVVLPNDRKIYISRTQVDVLPQFAMTAYASQGHTMDKVTVMLNSLCDHHAYYTALSRGRSVVNTTMLQGFDPKVITGRASSSLRHPQQSSIYLL